MMMRTLSLLSFIILACVPLHAQTIAEKKAGITAGSDLTQDAHKFLRQVNAELKELQSERSYLYEQVLKLYEAGAPETDYKALLDKINTVHNEIVMLEESWRQTASEAGFGEEYGLWHEPETNLGQLVVDYGSHNFVYLMNADVSSIKLSVDSNLPIPRASWDEMMEVILAQNGVGIKQLNPYLRQLYLVKEDNSGIRLITNHRKDLEVLDGHTRVAFMLTPEPSEVRRIWMFLDKFVNPNSTVLQMIGRDILIVAPAAEVQDLLKLHDFVLANRGDKMYRAVPVTRVKAEEMAKILSAIFDQFADNATSMKSQNPNPTANPKLSDRMIAPDKMKGGKPSEHTEINGLRVIALAHIAQAVFLVGTKEEIKKAEEIIREVENQVGEAHEKVVFTYVTKHSEPDDLAMILEKIYNLMITTGVGLEKMQLEEQARMLAADQKQIVDRLNSQAPIPPPLMPVKEYAEGFFLDDRYIVNNTPDDTTSYDRDVNRGRNNFIVDLKTGAIVMVVEADILPKLKELIKKLDVPKKQVQIEVLLFEKVLRRNNDFGINVFRLGSCASGTNATCTSFSDTFSPGEAFPFPVPGQGVFAFLVSRKNISKGIPGLDIAYKFLLSQDDISISANPSVLAINQTLARIEIDEEISVSTGAFVVPTADQPTIKEAYARARYGIVIEVTPTIHMSESDDLDDSVPNYVTLATNIKFETPHLLIDPLRPPVTRRTVTNQVRIEDGQTVIIGGLRKKTTEDSKEVIPFLGELPGVGKLFGSTSLHEDGTDMFIFLTPRIVVDPGEDLDRIRRIEMTRRPGDVPEFLCRLVESRRAEKERLFQASMAVIFGTPPARCYDPYGEGDHSFEDSCETMEYGEYDGR